MRMGVMNSMVFNIEEQSVKYKAFFPFVAAVREGLYSPDALRRLTRRGAWKDGIPRKETV
jgi:hypothetical protein